MENRDLHLEELWSTKKVAKSSMEDIYSSIDVYQKKKAKLNKVVALVIGFTSVWLALNVVWVDKNLFDKVWFNAGIGCCFLALLLLGFNYYRLNSFKATTNFTQKATDYIQFLVKEKQMQLQISKVWMNVYLVLFGIGIGVGTFPFIKLSDLTIQIVYYAVLFIWIGINLFWNKKKSKAKTNEINAILERLQNV